MPLGKNRNLETHDRTLPFVHVTRSASYRAHGTFTKFACFQNLTLLLSLAGA